MLHNIIVLYKYVDKQNRNNNKVVKTRDFKRTKISLTHCTHNHVTLLYFFLCNREMNSTG